MIKDSFFVAAASSMGLDSQLTESLFVGVPGPESEAHEYAFEMYA